ncbi:cytochrome c biogenesis CcdA family protein [Brevibacterium luteolum]|uniref:cytochrome c biogenesis CcdA family protein n=1 Tax=Brevibacterium luteolum TaxID=199591 RepID=UPI0020B38896|nr:cytochrome c biogenesis protein CcdA [Brevibacterium luteolum]
MTLAAPIGEVFSQTVLTGPMLLAIPVAVLAGAVSFFSPCVLPLVPGYVGYVTGLGATALTDRKTSKVIIGVSLFISGFAVVFVTIGLAFSAAGVLLSQWADVLNRVMGIVVIMDRPGSGGGFDLTERIGTCPHRVSTLQKSVTVLCVWSTRSWPANPHWL